MRLYQLDISWVGSAHELAALRWLLAASDDVGGVFLTGRGDTLAVLYAGSGHDFDQWARTLEPAHFQPRQQRSNEMRRFSIRLFAVGFLIGAIIAAAASVTSAFAAKAAPRANPSAQTPDQVIQWNRILLAILRTPGAQPATVHPTRSMAILHAAVYDAVNAIDRSHADYLVHVDAPTGASEPAAAAAAAHDVLKPALSGPTGDARHRPGRITGRHPRRPGQDRRCPGRRESSRGDPRTAGHRRLFSTTDLVRPRDEPRRLPAHPAGLCPAGVHAVALRDSLHAAHCRSVSASRPRR